jgi:putative endonuclease
MTKSPKGQKLKNYRAGLWAEYVSILYMMCKGLLPVKHRFKCAQGEIDLIVKNNKELVFVEVKYRKSFDAGLESINVRNQIRVRRAAEHFIAQNRFLRKSGDNIAMRFDVVVVCPYFRIKHIRNAF